MCKRKNSAKGKITRDRKIGGSLVLPALDKVNAQVWSSLGRLVHDPVKTQAKLSRRLKL